MRTAVLLWAAALAAQARHIPFEGGNVLRAEPFARLSVTGHRVELAAGAVVFHLEDSGAPPVEIVTPTVSVQPFLAGEYRVEVTRFGETHVTPKGAQVRVVAPQGAEWVSPGQKMIARGPAAAPEFRIVGAVSRWRRFTDRLAAAIGAIHIGASGGGGSDETPVETARQERSKPAETNKPDARTTPANHPNEGPIQSAHPSRGK
jgi:hypothetical protein